MSSNRDDSDDSSTNENDIKSRTEEEDRLSALPDDILHLILSLIGTEEVVKTSLFSKKWKFIWKGITSLFLNLYVGCYPESEEEKNICKKYVNMVSIFLAQCNGLKQFGIKVDFECTSMNSWIKLLIDNKVEDLRLTIRKYELPQILFSYASLKSLSVNSCAIVPQRDIRWINLKFLLIEDVTLSDDLIEKILSYCPVLEYLGLIDFWGLSRLSITARNLTTLVLEEHWNTENKEIEVSSPFVHNLMIIKNVEGYRFRLKNLFSVEYAEFEFYNGIQWSESHYTSEKSMTYIKEIFQTLQSAKDLYLGNLCIEVLSALEMKGWKLPPISTRLYLKVKAFNHEGSLPGILCILKSSPCLETLVIERSVVDLSEGDCGYEEFLTSRGPASSYLAKGNTEVILDRLKTIRIIRFKGEQLLTLVRILLRGAKVLQKIFIKDSVEHPSNFALRIYSFYL